MSNLQAEDPLVIQVVKALHSGEIEARQRLPVENLSLATESLSMWHIPIPISDKDGAWGL